ncbi:hypothetical protein KP509_21G049200 [Ceratopteris richardii]|uniref:Uncharacterized protein n=1 Tax=Ceratopteris richardii TaxID=49495 RepID=A0A8T2SB72_CERRI|nr:hypothetical protein KP509_21G049200 [Ceratopteris richardii]
MQGCSPSSPAGPRLWRPAAQRNLRNSWSSICMHISSWSTSSSHALSSASALVNALLSRRYVEVMDFGVLKEMVGIKAKANDKLFYQGELCFMGILTSFKCLIESISGMRKAKETMRTYLKGPVTGHLVEFSDERCLDSDAGDGDGIAVFSTLSVDSHEMLAQELINMFVAEIKIKVYLTAWLAEVNIKKGRKDEILEAIREEIQLPLPG